MALLSGVKANKLLQYLNTLYPAEFDEILPEVDELNENNLI